MEKYYCNNENFRILIERGNNAVVNVSDVFYIMINNVIKIDDCDTFCQVTQNDFYEICRDNTKIDEIFMEALNKKNGRKFNPLNEYAIICGNMFRKRSEKDGPWIDKNFENQYLNNRENGIDGFSGPKRK